MREEKAIRGGSFCYSRDFTRCASRFHFASYVHLNDLGLRVVVNGSGTHHKIRGGSFVNFHKLIRCTYRASGDSNDIDKYLGFRVMANKQSEGKGNTR